MQGLLPLIVIGVYLAVVMYIGIFAFRRGKSTGEDFFVASRSIGSIVFFLALFATNMTSVAILGSSGAAFKQGIGIYGMMAAISCFVIPLTLFFIGTRLWAIGKRLGHMTQVSFFRDRWECSSIGTLIFALSAFMLMPYLIVSIIGGGTILETLSYHTIPYWLGGAIVALVVMVNVFFGGMRGAVWVNVFQTILFLLFGIVAFVVIGLNLPDGFHGTVNHISGNKDTVFLLTRSKIPQLVFLSYCFIPLSSIMFPHMAIMCFTARKVTAFKKTVILYPLCITAIWLPCVFLGALGRAQPKVTAMMAGTTEQMYAYLDGSGQAPALLGALRKSADPAAQKLYAAAAAGPEAGIPAQEFGRRLAEVKDPALKPVIGQSAASNSDSVLLHMLNFYAPAWLAGILAAGIISAVMGSDCHQILALSTMFTRDVFDYYGGKKRFGERGSVFFGRFFIIVANTIAYSIALGKPAIFEIAVRYAFSGFAAMAPVMIAALFWKRSTKYGALAATLWIAVCLTLQRLVEWRVAPGTALVPFSINGEHLLGTSPIGALSIFGLSSVVPMVLGSCLAVIIASLLTRPPSPATIEKYFPPKGPNAKSPTLAATAA